MSTKKSKLACLELASKVSNGYSPSETFRWAKLYYEWISTKN